MKINEIFYSIQGESSFTGRPCIFIRTTYCNLRCTYCDTKYAYYEGKEYTVDQILQEIKKYPCKLVELTGGEPLLQSDINELAERLLELDYTVLCETSGSININIINNKVYRIVDFKTPDSGEHEKNDLENLARLTASDEIKFVICSKGDYDWAKQFIMDNRIENKLIYFSPEHDNMDPEELAEWILKDGLHVRFQLQIHKYIWHSELRGV